jgi:uncharacterized protein YggU (UPF0235/DUF167 family)
VFSLTKIHRIQIQTKSNQLLITQINQGRNNLISQSATQTEPEGRHNSVQKSTIAKHWTKAKSSSLNLKMD